jgi:uncharacterized iron-regulated membrane protein/flavodoxin
MKLLHKIIFWSHLLAGAIAGLVIFLMSFTGVVLMYEHQMVEFAERDVRWVTPPSTNSPRKNLDEIVAVARGQNPEARPTGIVLRSDPAASVAVGFGRDGVTYVDPYTGTVLGKASKLHDWFHDVIDWHRWLAMKGEDRATGKAITGACNLAFFWLAISGVYLWWPRSWRWRGLKSSVVFNTGLRGKARDWNWHNVIGFWSSGVLIVLTLTAAVMSYQWANDLLYTMTGSEPPPRTQAPGPVAQAQARPERAEADEARGVKTLASFDSFLARAEQQAPGWIMMIMRLPQRGDAAVNVLIQEPQAPHIFARSQLTLDRVTAEIVKWEPYAAARLGRKLRIWVRGLHTGEALGLFGQTVAGLASLGGCFLVWTGLAMAWRRFRYRNRNADDPVSIERGVAQLDTHSTIAGAALEVPEMSKETSAITTETTKTESTNGRSYNGHEGTVKEWSAGPPTDDSVLILYGTVTGNAEGLAKRLGDTLRLAGFSSRVRDMAHCQPNALTHAGCVLIVASTYGDGEPPDDAAHFCHAVVGGNGLVLTGVKFSVLALGNTTYDNFCKCGRDLDSALERHGATRLFPRIDCDVDYDIPARRWMDGVLTALRQLGHGTSRRFLSCSKKVIP